MVVGSLVASAAAAGDLGMWRLQDAKLQETVDAAALTLARTMAEGVSNPDRLTALAAAELETAGFLRQDGLSFSVEAGDAQDVSLIASFPAERLFGRVMGLAPANMSAQAIAGIGLEAVPLCAIALNEEDAPFGVRLWDDAELTGVGCRIASNNMNAYASLEARNGSRLSGSALCATGGAGTGDNSTMTPAANTGCERAPDPLGHIPEPTWPVGACIDNPGDIPGRNRGFSLRPGHYCNGLTLDERKKADFAPGTYFINGDFVIDTQEPKAFELHDVTLVVNGRVIIKPRRSFEITAPETGRLAGVAVWRTSTTPCPDTMLIGDNDSDRDPVTIGGAFYGPSCNLSIRGEVEVLTPADSFTLLAASRIEVANEAEVMINAARTYGEPICVAEGTGAVKLRHSTS